MHLSDRGQRGFEHIGSARRYLFVTHSQSVGNELDTSRDNRRGRACQRATTDLGAASARQPLHKKKPQPAGRSLPETIGGCRRERSGVRPLRQPKNRLLKGVGEMEPTKLKIR